MTENVPEDHEEETITYKRGKKKTKIKMASFPEEKVHHELTNQVCPDCHEKLKEIGAYPVRQELLFIPAQFKRLTHIQHVYKCVRCSLKNCTDKIVKAPVPKVPLNHSYSSASIIAHALYQKFAMKVPDYRQESYWQKLGLSLTRQHLSHWQIKCSEYYLEPLFNVLKDKLLKQPVLHADETYYNVLDSQTANTYYWVFLSGKHEKQGITLYHHDPSRGSEVPQKFLGNYAGYLHCDMWQAYDKLSATRVGCWAHARRKVFEAVPQNASEKSIAKQGLKKCQELFKQEKAWECLTDEERYQKRQAKLKPMMEKFFKWCAEKKPAVLTGSQLATAINYALNHQEAFMNVLLDGRLELSNNKAERAVKSVVIGRKNYLFSKSFKGAVSSGIVLSLIETAKRNDLDPEKYLNYLLQKLPNEYILNLQTLEAYLPWQEKVQTICK